MKHVWWCLKWGSIERADDGVYIFISRNLVPREVEVVVVRFYVQLESRTCVERHIFKENLSNGENGIERNIINRIRSALSSQRDYLENRV